MDVRFRRSLGASVHTTWNTSFMSSDTIATLCVLFESVAVMFVLLGMQLVNLTRTRAAPRPSSLSPGLINVAAGTDLIAIGVTLASLALTFWFLGAPPAVFGFACSGWLLLGTTGILLHGTAVMS